MANKLNEQQAAIFSRCAIFCISGVAQKNLIHLEQPDDKVRYDGKTQNTQR